MRIGAAGHDRQRDDEAFAPPDPVDIGPEHQGADRAHGEAGGEAQEGQSSARRRGRRSERHNIPHIPVLPIHRIIHPPHLVRRHLPRQPIHRHLNPRMPLQRILPTSGTASYGGK